MTQITNNTLSLSGNIWNILDANELQTEVLSRELNISINLAKLLYLRNISLKDANLFLNLISGINTEEFELNKDSLVSMNLLAFDLSIFELDGDKFNSTTIG